MLEFAKRSATVLIVTGILAILFDILTHVYTMGTAMTRMPIWGRYALIDDILELIAAFRPESRPGGSLIGVGRIPPRWWCVDSA